jgi:hypothetical protein
MLEAFSIPRSRRWTLLLLAVCGTLAAVTGMVGIDDNPLGVALAFLSATALVLAFVHPWRTSRQFRRLIYAAGLGFVVLTVLSNVFEAVAAKVGTQSPLEGLLNGAGAIFFLIAVLLCPPALLVGVIGAVVTSRRERYSTPPGSRTA